jgi:predicted DNA-binding transcriptional regulator AlpA
VSDHQTAGIEPLATIREWAAALQVSVPTIERLRRAKRLPEPSIMIGRLPRWTSQQIRQWIANGGK